MDPQPPPLTKMMHELPRTAAHLCQAVLQSCPKELSTRADTQQLHGAKAQVPLQLSTTH